MTTTFLDEKTAIRTAGELVQRLGDIPVGRVLLQPAPGTAVEADVVEVHRREGRVCELVERTLVLMRMAEPQHEGATFAVYSTIALIRDPESGRSFRKNRGP